jgi:hypothetical protein
LYFLLFLSFNDLIQSNMLADIKAVAARPWLVEAARVMRCEFWGSLWTSWALLAGRGIGLVAVGKAGSGEGCSKQSFYTFHSSLRDLISAVFLFVPIIIRGSGSGPHGILELWSRLPSSYTGMFRSELLDHGNLACKPTMGDCFVVSHLGRAPDEQRPLGEQSRWCDEHRELRSPLSISSRNGRPMP